MEYLYDTAAWAQEHTVGRRKMLPSRSIKLLDEAVRALVRLRGHAVPPLVAAVRVYDDYGDQGEYTRVLFYCWSSRPSRRSANRPWTGLQELAGDRHKDVAKQARAALEQLDARGSGLRR